MAQSSGEVIALAVVFCFLQLFFIALRVFARHVRELTLAADDYLIMMAGFFYVLCVFVPVLILCVDANLGNHVRVDASGNPEQPTYLYLVVNMLFDATSVVPLVLAKASILCFYLRIFRGTTFSVITWSTLGLVAVWGISFFVTLFLLCYPVSKFLHEGSDAPGVTCINGQQVYYSLAITDFLIDIIVWSIPQPFVWRLQMPRARKVAVSGAFLLGLVAIAASIMRMVTFVQAAKLLPQQQIDYTYYTAPTSFWTLIETSLAIVSACLPTLRPAFQDVSPETLFKSVWGMISLKSTRSSDTMPSQGARKNGSSITSDSKDSHRLISGDARTLASRDNDSMTLEEMPRLPKDRIPVKTTLDSAEDAV